MLFYNHFKDEHIPHVWHRLLEAQRKVALQHFLDSPDLLHFANRQEYLDVMRKAYLASLPHSQRLQQPELKTYCNWHEVD
jgi:hypothetical protein